MARLRKFVAYRRLERPYTRISKYKQKSYIRTKPNIKIIRFDMGEKSREFPVKVTMISKQGLQIRQEAIESARLTTIRLLEKRIGKTGFHFKIKIFPFHVLRENALASGAGADRLSTGMKMSFGKPIGIAAQVQEGQELMFIATTKNNVELARRALKRATQKIPGSYSIVTTVKAAPKIKA
jgi:large subunit ribosomal protein L10e